MKVATLLLVCLIAVTTFVLPARASAQIVVVRSADVPISAAEVGVWDTQGRVATGRTDFLGVVHLNLERAPIAPSFLLVRRIGFVPARRPYERVDSLTIELERAPTALPTHALRIKELRCPSRDEAGADSIWRASASRYSERGTQFRIEWSGYTTEETVTAEGRGYPDPYELRPPRMGTVGSIHGQSGMESPPPYAMYEKHVGIGGEYWQWRYASLQGFSSDHFLTDRFRETHTLVTLGETSDATILGFCPRNDSEADLQGELQIARDGLLTSARWFFHVPHDDEDAGGDATFAPTRYEGRDYLVAIRGASWRRAGKNIYNQRRFERVQWVLKPRV
jgi:hypothetical protein